MLNNSLITKLVENAKKGDMHSLEAILKDTEKEVYSYLYYLTKSEYELSDMVQEILMKVALNIKKLKNPNSYKGWLNTIITRHYCDCMRKKKRNKNKYEYIKEELSETLEDKKNTPITDCINNELIERIKSSVIKLPEPYRIALIMREFQGLSYDEIAKFTNTSIGTIKSRIARARSQLKEYMKPYME